MPNPIASPYLQAECIVVIESSDITLVHFINVSADTFRLISVFTPLTRIVNPVMVDINAQGKTVQKIHPGEFAFVSMRQADSTADIFLTRWTRGQT